MTRRALPFAIGILIGLTSVLLLVAQSFAATGKSRTAAKPSPAPKPVSAKEPVYLRISVPPDTTVYVQFKGTDMRMATTIPGLKTAKPVKVRQDRRLPANYTQFPEVTLPVPAKSLPAGWTGIAAELSAQQGPVDPRTRTPWWYVYGNLGPSCKDADGTVWTYLVRMAARAGDSPDTQTVFAVADPADLSLSVTAKPEGRQIGVGLAIASGQSQLYEIRKDGVSAEVAEVIVTDQDGKQVAAKRGPVNAFGFG